MANDPLTPNKGESLDLASRAFRDVKTGRYTRGVDIKGILSSINVLEPTTKSLSEAAAIAEEQVKLFSVKFLKTINIKPDTKVQEVKKPGLSTIREGSEKLASSSFSLAKLALLIPLLFNETTREILSGFFEGFLKGIGMSEEGIELMKSIAAGAAMAFKLFLGYKVVKSVLDVFSALKQLANVTGLLGLLIEKKGTELAVREQTITDNTSVLEGDNKNLKKKGNRLQRIVRTLKVRGKLLLRAAKRFSTYKRVALGALKAIRAAVKIIKTATAWTGLGFLLGAAIDAGIGTLIDYYTKDDGEKEPSESTFSTVGKMFADNFVQSLTFGAVNLNDLKNMINGLIDAGIKKKIIPEFLGNKLKFDTKTVEKPPASATTPAAVPSAPAQKSTSSTTSTSGAAGAAPAAPVSMPSASGSAMPPSTGASTSAAAPASTPSSTPMPSPTVKAESIQTQSESNISDKKELSSSSMNVVNIDNSQNLVMNAADKGFTGSDIIFNSSVGA